VFGLEKGRAYADSLRTKGAYEDKEFGYNLDEPYKDRAAAAKEQGDSSTENVFSGLGEIGEIAGKYAAGGFDPENLGGEGDTVGAGKTSETDSSISTPSTVNRVGLKNPNSYNAKMPSAGVINAMSQAGLDVTQKNEVIQFLNGMMKEDDLSQETINFLVKYGITDVTRGSNVAVPSWKSPNAFTYTLPPTVGPVSGNTLTY
jgi:hypothetical protein